MTVTPKPGAGPDLIGAALDRAAERVERHLPSIATDEEPRHVHQTRVGLRRIRTITRIYAPFLDDVRVREIRPAAKTLASTLGPLRDADVMLDRLRGGIGEVDSQANGSDEVIERLERKRAKARKRVLKRIGGTDVRRFGGWARPFAEADEPLALTAATRTAYGDLASTVAELGSEARPGQLHAVRLATKRARYAHEVIAPLFGPDGELFNDALRDLQALLGRMNDAITLARWLADEVPALGRRSAFVAGAVAERERAIVREAVEAWPRSWASVRETAPWPGPSPETGEDR